MNQKEYINRESQVKNELDKAKTTDNNKKCIKKVLNFFETNYDKCEKSLSNSDLVANQTIDFINNMGELSSRELNELISSEDKNIILVLTANKIENNIFIWSLKNIVEKKLDNYLLDDEDDSICVRINYCSTKNYIIIHHHIGKTGDEYTRRAINEVTHFINPDFIVLLGICYGLDMEKQEMGTVNISEEVTGVRINFRDTPFSDEIIIDPEIEFEKRPNERMTTTITRKLSVIEIKESESSDALNHMYGRIVSANSLMSCKKVKDSITEKLKNDVRGSIPLVGGEMEACGIFKSNYRGPNNSDFDRWIVIKAICDWGESKNSLATNKEENTRIKNSLQAYAMMKSCQLFDFLISNKAFR